MAAERDPADAYFYTVHTPAAGARNSTVNNSRSSPVAGTGSSSSPQRPSTASSSSPRNFSVTSELTMTDYGLEEDDDNNYSDSTDDVRNHNLATLAAPNIHHHSNNHSNNQHYMSGTSASSVMEYSDTSDDMSKQRHYQNQPQPPLLLSSSRNESTSSASVTAETTTTNNNIQQQQQRRQQQFYSSESANSHPQNVHFRSDDDVEGGAPPPPPPPPPDSKNSSSWIANWASFRSPKPPHNSSKQQQQQQLQQQSYPNHNSNTGSATSGPILQQQQNRPAYSYSTGQMPSPLTSFEEESPLLRVAKTSYSTGPTFANNNNNNIPSFYHQQQQRSKTLSSSKPQQKQSSRPSSRRKHNAESQPQRPYPRHMTTTTTTTTPSHRRAVSLAASFLDDYEGNRPPTLPVTLDTTSTATSGSGSTCSLLLLQDITESQRIAALWINHGVLQTARALACAALFLSSGMEGFDNNVNNNSNNFRSFRIAMAVLNAFALLILLTDVYLHHLIHGSTIPTGMNNHHTNDALSPTARSQRLLVQPMIMFALLLAMEMIGRLSFVSPPSGSGGISINGNNNNTNHRMVLVTSVCKPLVLWYVSQRARDAVQALARIFRIVLRICLMELLVILMFAATACRLFHNHDAFRNLSTSWLSLFELSTTVVNPSLWMPLYDENKWSAIFFICFIITSVFYLHSLVLSVVFSTYVQAASEIHQRSSTDRENAVQLAFLSLLQEQQLKTTPSTTSGASVPAGTVHINLVRDTLRRARPHYNAMKINALVEIVDPTNRGVVDYPTFRAKIRQALNASIRTARNASPLAMSVELIAVAVALINFVYVILVTSTFEKVWFNAGQQMLGSFITLVAGFELLARFNPLHIPNFTPLTRLNATFDGLALVAAMVSLFGMTLYMANVDASLDYILMGRAIDMIRIMRFFPIFRDVVRRSSDVIPALAGPLVLVVSTLHVFVYMGMALWGGMVHVGQHDAELTYLYDRNNFNSYPEGVVTMFQVLVVNDWHAIAQVFLFASRCSHPYIVYPFFICGNLVGVSIMLNVLTAFFVETFVTKLDDDVDRVDSHSSNNVTTKQKERDFSIQTSENSAVKRISSQTSLLNMEQFSVFGNSKKPDRGADADSEASSGSELFEFDVYEREGFDKIMQTVAGGNSSAEFARQICSFFEVFESMTPGRETVGYLISDQQTLERFGNHRFQEKAAGFLEENQLHAVVSEVNSQLLALSSRPSFDLERALSRKFPHRTNPSRQLEISASLLRRHPALSLFVARERPTVADLPR